MHFSMMLLNELSWCFWEKLFCIVYSNIQFCELCVCVRSCMSVWCIQSKSDTSFLFNCTIHQWHELVIVPQYCHNQPKCHRLFSTESIPQKRQLLLHTCCPAGRTVNDWPSQWVWSGQGMWCCFWLCWSLSGWISQISCELEKGFDWAHRIG